MKRLDGEARSINSSLANMCSQISLEKAKTRTYDENPKVKLDKVKLEGFHYLGLEKLKQAGGKRMKIFPFVKPPRNLCQGKDFRFF